MNTQDEPNPTAEPGATPSPPPEQKPPPKPSELIMAALVSKEWKDAEPVLRENIPLALTEEWQQAGLPSYNLVLFLDQSNQMGEEHADRIYTALGRFPEKKDVLLVLGSRGGRIEPAYLISKNCKAAAQNKFVVAIPRRAKSAATLLALGADEIHMGGMSELGPIDPQLGRIPALSLTNALQTIARVVTEYPACSDMFSKYLQSQLDLGILGYFERINESAIQYGSRLLHGKTFPGSRTPVQLATHLVNHYKDHSFVIDKDETLQLLGDAIVKIQTAEYTLSNRIDQNLRWVSRVARWMHKKVVTFVGGIDSCVKIRDMNEDEE